MSKPSHFVDVSLLLTNPAFRQLLIARTVSLVGLGMLTVGIPIQVYGLTGASVHVGLVSAVEGVGLFAGLLLGGVLADLYDRRRLILFARSICGIGFVALAVNSALPHPSLGAIYGLALWDGFFGALGVSGLMAAMPMIVGRENLMHAGALGMITARFSNVVAPSLGGLVIAAGGVTSAYALTAVGTLVTVLTLLGLPPLVPQRSEEHHPLRLLAEAFAFVLGRRVLLAIFALGTLLTVTSGIRVLFPALIDGAFAGGSVATGLMYSAVPLGATLGAVVSGWPQRFERPDHVMVAMCLLAFVAVIVLGASGSLVAALAALIVYGYAVAIASLIQYTLIQKATPDNFLGRVNSLWAAQDTLGDIVGAAALGTIATALLPATAILVAGLAALALGVGLALLMRTVGLGEVARAQEIEGANP
ncbi:enterobactin transporter EntS [Acuticoccus mangrovi]|uniref:Multidrug efflux pump Tap n=1 Tax=Acuticoccus mangrovi TaxID=2796142 RepID=A0A934MJC7_9HYPH|nr:enterobactin transporter EntS [Acuticoccus mangrovi]MBJ3778765.1 enterobactin transporter EntS [Acuticoccus mangrovi]